MTNKEAAEIILNYGTYSCGYCHQGGDEVPKAFDMAAKALLEAQEPRVMTLEEVLENAQKTGFPCWVEDHIEDIGPAFLFPAVVTSDDAYVQYTGNDYYEGAIYHWAYNKRLRCWTSRPTDEQREAVKWDE